MYHLFFSYSKINDKIIFPWLYNKENVKPPSCSSVDNQGSGCTRCTGFAGQ